MESHAHRKLKQQIDTSKKLLISLKDIPPLDKNALIIELRWVAAELEERECGKLCFSLEVKEQ